MYTLFEVQAARYFRIKKLISTALQHDAEGRQQKNAGDGR
jgi:hypothetical protein